jgi:molybdate transport system substrate-binding protein
MTNRLLILALWLGTINCGRAPEKREIHVAAAANLQTALAAVARDFASKTAIHVVPTIGATAQLTQQIDNGAPVDVFLAADTEHVDQLVAEGVADPGSRAIYARGRLVLWAPQRPDIKSLADLASPQVNQIGCARPELAPYGAAAIQALKKAGLWTAVEPKLVYGQSISAAKQYADSGNVAASFTALSLVYDQHYILIDERLYNPIEQALCIVKQSTQAESARRFCAFLLGEEGQAILAKYGYAKPSGQ